MYRHVARTNAISKFRSRPLLKTSKGAHLARCLGSVGKTTVLSNDTPFRKLLKDEAKRRRILGEKKGVRDDTPCSNRWELTVGIEVHAQLNTDRKTYDLQEAATSLTAEANSHASVFDLALPGSQPIFQKGAIIPAIRAALAFDCNVITKSRFDRKHYFYPDQPAGYQITQFYEPFARDGSITLYEYDGIAAEDGKSVLVGLKQIQLEQDTAKTIHQGPSTSLLDFNRVSHPLIEIITLPQIHHPRTAAACVKKIQSILQAVSAVTTGMEMGGLRADVNVSVRSKHAEDNSSDSHAYSGIEGLGQRTEIKNLSSFKAVEDAIIAERDRQIRVLEAGGKVEGETRGWSLGSTETTRLRGKEGEVDYRYMPDPDLSPLIIDPKLTEHIWKTLPKLPDTSIDELVTLWGLTLKDAKTLTSIDDGARLDYFDGVLEALNRGYPDAEHIPHAKIAANWLCILELRDDFLSTDTSNRVLHELGGLLSASDRLFSENEVSAASMASIIGNLIESCITGRTAKQLLVTAFDGDSRDINTIISEENLALEALPREKYVELAQELISENEKMVQQIKVKGHHKKLNWFVGQMMRKGEGKVEASKAEAILREILRL